MKIIDKIKNKYLSNFEYAKSNLVCVGLFGFFGFPIYYLIWNNIFPQQYENFYFRIFCSILFLPFIFYFKFSDKIKIFFPYYFLLTLFIALPFFFSFMLIKNNFSSIWVASLLTSIYLLIFLIYNWILITLMTLMGFAMSYWLASLTDSSISFANFNFQYTPIYFFVIASGVIMQKYLAQIENNKVKNMQAFGGSVAHEMRNPLNAINLLLTEVEEVLQKQKSDIKADDIEKVGQLVSTILNCTQRANNIIDIILSNIRNDNSDNLAREVLSVNYLINQAVKEYGYNNQEERKKIKLELGEGFKFKGEAAAFIYVLFNLVKNALYYLETYPNSIVTIRTIKGDDGFNKVIVKDTGPGIPQEKIKSLFKAFNTSGKAGGTGLGLDFVYKTMKAFNGNVECNSILGEFTEFVLSFPICNENIKEEEPAKNTEESPISNINLAGKKILIIDDEALNRKIICRMLEKALGLKALEASNGQDALQILQNEKEIDLIFTDINMPVMDGYDFAKNVRFNQDFSDYKDIKIIAFTADDSPKTLEKINSSGINYNLNKGYNLEKITDFLNTILK